MENVAVVVIALATGLLLQRMQRFPDNAATTLNLYVVYIALPALILSEIPGLEFTSSALIPVIAAWGIMTLSALLVLGLAAIFRWPRPVLGALMLLVPLGNTGFVGIPLIEAHLGAKAIPYAILYDQLGTFIALNTYGIVVAAYYSASGSTSVRAIVRTILGFPPFIALLLAFATLGLPYPDWLSKALSRISSTLVPVVMVAVGLQWQLKLSREYVSPFLVGLLCILAISPAMAWLAMELFQIDGLVAHVVILEAAMPAMISAGVLAISYQLAPKFAASLCGYSLLFSLVSVWLWRLLIG